jgi:hypothetical protein
MLADELRKADYEGEYVFEKKINCSTSSLLEVEKCAKPGLRMPGAHLEKMIWR